MKRRYQLMPGEVCYKAFYEYSNSSFPVYYDPYEGYYYDDILFKNLDELDDYLCELADYGEV